MRSATATASLALVALALGLSACGGGSGKSSTPTPSPNPDALALQKLAAASRDTSFTATYAAKAGDRTATISVFVQNAATYRVDIAEGGITASLFGTANGSIACSTPTGVASTCFLVAEPGKAIPGQYDAGVERVFTRDLPALATNANAFTVTARDTLPADGTLLAARCFTIAAQRGTNLFTSGLLDDVDLGTYCLADSGPPRRLDFSSGSLTLQTVGPAPTTEQLTPPAAANPIPTPTAMPSSSTPPPLGLLGSPAPKA